MLRGNPQGSLLSITESLSKLGQLASGRAGIGHGGFYLWLDGCPYGRCLSGGSDPPASRLELRLMGAVVHQLMDSLAGVLVEWAAAGVNVLESESGLMRLAEIGNQLRVGAEGEGEIEHGWLPVDGGGCLPHAFNIGDGGLDGNEYFYLNPVSLGLGDLEQNGILLSLLFVLKAELANGCPVGAALSNDGDDQRRFIDDATLGRFPAAGSSGDGVAGWKPLSS